MKKSKYSELSVEEKKKRSLAVLKFKKNNPKKWKESLKRDYEKRKVNGKYEEQKRKQREKYKPVGTVKRKYNKK